MTSQCRRVPIVTPTVVGIVALTVLTIVVVMVVIMVAMIVIMMVVMIVFMAMCFFDLHRIIAIGDCHTGQCRLKWNYLDGHQYIVMMVV